MCKIENDLCVLVFPEDEPREAPFDLVRKMQEQDPAVETKALVLGVVCPLAYLLL